MTAVVPLLGHHVYVAPWRIQQTGKPYPGLPAAISSVRKAFPDRQDLQQLAFFLCPRLPGRPRTSDSLKTDDAFSGLQPLEDVIVSAGWLGMNTELAVNVVWSESDRPSLSERARYLRSRGVPIKWRAGGTNGGGHIGIVVKTPIVTGIRTAAKDKAMLRKLSLTRSYLTTAIDGDHAAGLRGMTKNPFSSRWDVEVFEGDAVDLEDILTPLQALAEEEGWKAPKRRYKGDRDEQEPSPDGRNCACFDLTRWWAYDGAVTDGEAILTKALQVNEGFAEPLAYGEVASVAKSITKFMQTRFDGRGRHAPLSPETIDARRTAGRRARAERERNGRTAALLAVVQRIQERGGVAGQAAVAAEAGVSRRTVQAAWADLWPVIVNKAQPDVPLSGSSVVEATGEPPPTPTDPPNAAVPAQPSNVMRLSDLLGSQAAQPIDWSPEGIQRRARLASKARCAEREAWHELASRKGGRAYRDAVAHRFAALFRERKAALNALWDAPEPDPDVDPLAIIASRERMAEAEKILRLGWASKLKAEDRIYRRWCDYLMTQDCPKPRFRTELDALDIVANRIPLSPEQEVIRRFEARVKARQDAIDGIVAN